MLVGVHTVNAQYISTDVQVTYGSLRPFVNQRVELTASNSGGTPPYTYQWYINDQPVQGANSSKLEFIESTQGLYYISLGITDSLGNYTLATFMGAFFIKVDALTTPLPSPTPIPTPTLTSTTTPTLPEFQVWTIPLLLIIMATGGLWVYFKKNKPHNTLTKIISLNCLVTGIAIAILL